jgi:CheY-like chemotaxis protein
MIEAITHPTKKRASILLVEDNPADANLVEEALFEAKVDCGLQVVGDGTKAVDLIASIEQGQVPCPDLVILDLNLPRLSGEEVLKRLRASNRCGGLKVLIVTSSDAPNDRQRAIELGATDYFRKPSTLELFLQLGPRVRQLLES